MINLEIPIGKRTPKYRFFEMLPAILSYGAFVLLIVLSILNPILAAFYLLLIIVSMLFKAIGMAVHTVQGHKVLEAAERVDWHARLADLENPKSAYDSIVGNYEPDTFEAQTHTENLKLILEDTVVFPRPSQIYNAVIVAAYNESYEVLAPTIKSVADSTYDSKKIILVMAYEERGGEAIEKTAFRLKNKFGNQFYDFLLVKHPKDIPNEVIGKGGNITNAGHFLQGWIKERGIAAKNVIVTTLDSDNRPHKSYFDYLTYEYIVHKNRKHLSYQPIALFLNNIWDVPAPMRVIATSNSFWNIISSMRPHSLRNFASHSQPMDALEGMNFWSTRTIVEDGHQYWRSYFYFGGDYAVLPIYVSIYQDAVLSNSYAKTLKSQFIQIRRWDYGASDVPYVATRIFTNKRNVPFFDGLLRFFRLVDGHVSLACVSILAAFGGWAPLFINSQAARSIPAHQLPDVISVIQQIALIGVLVTIILSFKMLPPRPERYKKRRNFGMVAQWILIPVIAIVYSSAAALYSQTKLFLGKYLDKFDVTDKATYQSVDKAKQKAKAKRSLGLVKRK